MHKCVYWVGRTKQQVVEACKGVMSNDNDAFKYNLAFYLSWLPELEACACALHVIRLTDQEYRDLKFQKKT